MQEDEISWSVWKALLVAFVTVATGFLIQRRRRQAAYAGIPGPGGLPIIGNILDVVFCEDFIPKLMRMAKNFDGIFKIDGCIETVVVISKPEYLKTFYTSTVNINKADMYNGVQEIMTPGIFSSNGETWKKLRKMWFQHFIATPPELFLENFCKYADELVAELRTKADGPFFQAATYLAVTAATSLHNNAFGERLPANVKWFVTDGMDFLMRVAYFRIFKPLYYFTSIFRLTPVGMKFMKICRDLHRVVEFNIREKIDEIQDLRNKNEPLPPLYLYNVMPAYPNESMALWTGDFTTIFATGTDTIGGTSGWILVMLGLYPEVQQRVFEEDAKIRAALNEAEPSFDDLQKYEYLDRVIKETLRLFPPGAAIARKLSEDTYFGKYLVPKGTNVGALQMYANHDPDVFPDPLTFNPDRFLPENAANIPPYAFNPFSAGPRQCPGIRYANIALKTFIPAIVRNFLVFSGYKNLQEALDNAEAKLTLKDRLKCTIRIVSRK